MSAPAKNQKIPALTGIRTPIVIAIIALHSQLHGFKGAVSGTETFFVLSGFLITGLLIAEQSRTGRIDYALFLVKRVLRIVPPLFITTAVSGLALALIFPSAASRIETQVGYALTFTMDYYQGSQPAAGFALGHLWSLGVEEKFYLLWPPLLAACIWLTRRRPHALPLLVAQLALLGYAEPALRYGASTSYYPSVYFYADSRTGGLLLGCAAAILLHQHPDLRAWFGRWWVGVIGLAVLVAVIADPPIVGSGQRHEVLLGLPVVGLASVALVMHLASTRSGVVAPVLGWGPLAWIGDRSYALYLWQLPVIVVLIRQFDFSPLAAFLGGFTVSLVLAILLRVLVEAPLAAYSSRLRADWSSRRIRLSRGTAVWSARLSLAAALITSVGVGIGSRDRTVDDGDIVLRYVHNALDGRGWVWNTGSLRNACTSALHPFLILLLAGGGVPPVNAATIVGTLGLALGACSAVILLRRLGLPFAGAVAGIALPLLPLWTETWGLETPVFVGLLLAYGAVATSGRPSAGLVAALSLTRPDGILLFGPAFLRARRQGNPLRFTVLALAPAALLGVVALVRTGTPLPASAAAKRAQGQHPEFTTKYLPNMLRQLDKLTFDRTDSWIILLLGIPALAAVISARKWPIIDLVAVTGAQTLVYAVLGIPGYYWYYLPFLVVLGVVLLAGTEIGIRALLAFGHQARAADRPRLRSQFATAMTAVAAIAAVVLSLQKWAPTENLIQQPRESIYFAASRWMSSQGPVQSVGVSEVGVFGVALPNARVEDLIGLATSPQASPGQGAAEFLSPPPQWLLLHLTVGGLGGIDEDAKPELDRAAAEGHVSLTDFGFGSRSSETSVWLADGGVLDDHDFDQLYRMVRVFTYPGAGPLAVFETRPGVTPLQGLPTKT